MSTPGLVAAITIELLAVGFLAIAAVGSALALYDWWMEKRR